MDARTIAPIRQKAKVLQFPKRPKMPPTVSVLVADYLAVREPRGLYLTPLPDDWRRNVQ